MLSHVDRFLNATVMHKLVQYVLLVLAAVAIVLATLGFITYSPIAMVVSLVVLIVTCYAANYVLSEFFRAPYNSDSSVITALILFFVLAPAGSLLDGGIALVAAVIAMTSKYLIAYRKQHLLNPAAFAAVVVGIPTGAALWWVGTPWRLPFVAIGGALVARKVRRVQMVLITIAAGTLVSAAYSLAAGTGPLTSVPQFILSWPIVFFATFMVTEPITAPGTRRAQLMYGSLVGALSSIPLHLGAIYTTPELTLVAGNVASFFTGLKRRLVLKLAGKKEVAREIHEFSFVKPEGVTFSPGQYLEWTLPHAKPDSRGVRRYFTIASAPSESEIKIGVRISEKGSSFKQHLAGMEQGQILVAGSRAGSFTLPSDEKEKLAFIAGGIGVTPFRSMVRHLIDTGQKRDIALFYACRTHADAAYTDLFAEAGEAFGLRTTYVFSDEDPGAPEGSEKGFIGAELLERVTPDFRERTWYLSGPDAMVQAYRKLLRERGVSTRRIRTDYFPGF